jgi:1-phosphatidylinositol phosphodiesterase
MDLVDGVFVSCLFSTNSGWIELATLKNTRLQIVRVMKLVPISVITVVIILAFTTWSSYREHIFPFPAFSVGPKDKHLNSKPAEHDLASLALDKVLQDAASIFGHLSNLQTNTTNWMAAYPDSTLLVHMNLPGTHDAATWNYSAITQHQTTQITDLVNNHLAIASENFRCQDSPLIDMLNAGIRVFDLRYAFDVTNSSIVFWHSVALLSETASLESVLFGFYRWLDDHPTEAVFLSLQFEGVRAVSNLDDAEVQRELHRILTSHGVLSYVNQARDELGTLGDARGRITLLRRFDLSKLRPEYEGQLRGLHFSPSKWTVNGKDIKLVYNPSLSSSGETGKAYIQDYYQPDTPSNSSLAENIEDKMVKAIAHINRATQQEHMNDLFWHFLSSTNIAQNQPKTPLMMALGGEEVEGVNQRLLSVLRGTKGKRLGIVMFDFFEQPRELLPLFLSLLAPEDTKRVPST